MKISYNWLKEYIKTEQSPERLCEILTDTGLEVEGLQKVEAIKGGLNGVVVGHVLTCEPHENADRLKVTTVDVGKETLQIVCGAPNVAIGQKVVVATVGTTLYPTPEEPFEIKKSKIRGVESFGMICSEDELGLGSGEDGIMVLPEDTEIGLEAAKYFNLSDDYQIEIGLTPNRSDALGHFGVARDIVAFSKVHDVEKLNLILPDTGGYQIRETGDKIKLEVEAPEDAPYYMGCLISDVKIASSPDWLRNYLTTIGLSPINNVVDITNFVMHELGTPLHAFDYDKVGDRIVVKHAEEGESFVTLDGVERKLSSEDLMITNDKKNLCIAGVFGGDESGVSDSTTSIFLEAAYFNPVSVRKTAKRHGLSTDASFRFERGVDYNMIEFAMKRAAALITEIAGGNVAFQPDSFLASKIENKEVMFSIERCNQLIGMEIDSETVVDILYALDFKITHRNGDQLKLEVPSFRVDVTREADVIEEVLRIYGFNNVPLPEKWNMNLSQQNLRSEEKRLDAIADLLIGKGYFEMMNNSLTTSEYITNHGNEAFDIENAVKMLNPLSIELDVMRQSLIFQGLASIVHNVNRQNSDLKLFEFGSVYQKFGQEFSENKRLAIFLTGMKEPEGWNSNHTGVSFFTLKGVVDAIFNRLGLSKFITTKALKKSILEDGIQLYIQRTKIGEIGWTSQKLNKSVGLKQRVYVADIDWAAVLSFGNRNNITYQTLPRTFAVRRDFSLLINEDVSYNQIEEISYKTDRKLLKEVNLFDVYEGSNLPDGKKSYAVSFYFQDEEKTLSDKVIDKIMDKIRVQLEKQVQAELRS